MAIRVLTIRNTHIQYDDVNYRVDDTVNSSEGFFHIKTLPGAALVARIYNDGIIYWHQPPAQANWVTIGAHLKVTLP